MLKKKSQNITTTNTNNNSNNNTILSFLKTNKAAANCTQKQTAHRKTTKIEHAFEKFLLLSPSEKVATPVFGHISK
jgi:hypothetical protein